MKFSLLYEMQLSGPTAKSEVDLFRACVDQVVLADRLGYHAVWAVEHHGLREYSHSSAPEVFLSYVAARTESIRLGHGVVLLPHRYNHPIRVAERIATLDILSGGRVQFGSGQSASLVEQKGFECNTATLHAQWLEALRIIPRMWQDDVFEYRGSFFDIPPTQVVPKPVQEPHPPLFVACTRPESAELAGRLGLGALNFAVGSNDYVADKVSAYRQALRFAEPIGTVATNHFSCAPLALVLPDDHEACRHGFRGARFFGEAFARYFVGSQRPTGPLAVSRDFLSNEDLESARALRNTPDDMINACVGDPRAAREFVQRFAEIGVDELILIMQMGTVPNELVLESVKTFGEQVLPHFAD